LFDLDAAIMRSLPVLVDLATRANRRKDDVEVVHAKKDSKTGSAFSFSIFSRNRSRVGASHRSKYFAADADIETR